MNFRPASRSGIAGLLGALLLAIGAADGRNRAAAQQPAAPADAGTSFAALARQSGEPRIPGLNIVYLHPLGNPADAGHWKYIIAHQTEGPAGSAYALAQQQSRNPTKRGVTIWVETDGTVYWSTAETAIPTHGDGANRNDSKYVDNSKTYRIVVKTSSLGVEFVGNHPDVRKPVTPEQMKAWLTLLPFLQERYGIPAENVYAHNWIDFKDRRYCEGCELGAAARKLGYVPGRSAAAVNGTR
jgi:N-acetylmuramoyl-L-alanine amidase